MIQLYDFYKRLTWDPKTQTGWKWKNEKRYFMQIATKENRNGYSNVRQNLKKKIWTTQSWLRFCAPNAGDLNSILGQGTKSHMPQPKDPTCHNRDLAQSNK